MQRQGLEFLGRDAPTKGLLMPVLIEDVHYVRLRQHVTHSSRVSRREHAISRFEELLEETKASLRKFEYYATPEDPKREAIEAEVKALEEGLQCLRESKEEMLRERYRQERVLPYVYLFSGEIVRPYVRDVGLIVAGPKLRIAWADQVRRERKDKVKLEPLLTVGQLKVYSEREWQEAKD